MFKCKVKTGFTLIELIMVIAIISVLVAINLPRYGNFKTTSVVNSEDAVIAALKTAINGKYLENIVQGMDPANAWPTGNLFDLLEKAPPNSLLYSFDFNTEDFITWRIVEQPSGFKYVICCPHYNGKGTPFMNYWESGGMRNGNRWIYFYNDYYLMGNLYGKAGAISKQSYYDFP